jgi:hypothetical protein
MNTDTNNEIIHINSEGKTTCLVCENDFQINFDEVHLDKVNNIDELKAYLKDKPTAVIYFACPHCLMEYMFKLVDDHLVLEINEEEK